MRIKLKHNPVLARIVLELDLGIVDQNVIGLTHVESTRIFVFRTACFTD